MSKHKNTSAACRSIFKNGGIQTTKREYTRIWIELINQLERRKWDGRNSDKMG